MGSYYEFKLESIYKRVGSRIFQGLMQEDGYSLSRRQIDEFGLQKEIDTGWLEVVARDPLYDVSWLRFKEFTPANPDAEIRYVEPPTRETLFQKAARIL